MHVNPRRRHTGILGSSCEIAESKLNDLYHLNEITSFLRVLSKSYNVDSKIINDESIRIIFSSDFSITYVEITSTKNVLIIDCNTDFKPLVPISGPTGSKNPTSYQIPVSANGPAGGVTHTHQLASAGPSGCYGTPTSHLSGHFNYSSPPSAPETKKILTGFHLLYLWKTGMRKVKIRSLASHMVKRINDRNQQMLLFNILDS